MRRTRSDSELYILALCFSQYIGYAGKNRTVPNFISAFISKADTQDISIEGTARQTMQMKRRVESRDAISANGLDKFVMWKRIAVFGVDVLPGVDFGRFGIEDETIEVKDQYVNHMPHYT